MSRLEEAVAKSKAKLAEYEGIVDVRDNSRPGKLEYQLRIEDRRKGRPNAQSHETADSKPHLGIRSDDVGRHVRS